MHLSTELDNASIDEGFSLLCQVCSQSFCCRWKHGILSFQGVATLSNREWFEQLPFIFLVSAGGGLLGAAFNWLHERIFAVRLEWLSQTMLLFKTLLSCACLLKGIPNHTSIPFGGTCLLVLRAQADASFPPCIEDNMENSNRAGKLNEMNFIS